ncbi:F-box/LRR-repeat protein At2g43260 [Triticum aestivum]|uniref:F-box/LRR-repeat protein At2g43260 n=1 Tax=Triticum aestivum TaxID=4565 RepID=UPI001D0050CC|nr:F-box/LRR-repeat protein At2g43260-like [Triticum aestivum]
MSCYPQHLTELVSTEILLRLPVNSLLRFRCVCKAWRDTIDNDFFVRAHLRAAQNTFTLIAPHVKADGMITAAGLYRWEQGAKAADDDDRNTAAAAGVYPWEQDTATLVHPMGADYSVPGTTNVSHDLAHCDGLVLVPSDAMGHQAFGLGHDPRSKAYKVARFFYRSMEGPVGNPNHYTLGMEVLTVGAADLRWRETAAPPPYPALPGRTATFFKDSLLWTVEELLFREAPGFIRFKLEDESFAVLPGPPCSPSLDYAAASLAELRGELCVCVARHEADYGHGWHETWICRDLDDAPPPRWEPRHVVEMIPTFPRLRCLRPIAAYTDVLVLHAEPCYLCRETQEPGRSKDLAREKERNTPLHMQLKLRYYHPDTGMFVEYPAATCAFQVISYVPSLVPV